MKHVKKKEKDLLIALQALVQAACTLYFSDAYRKSLLIFSSLSEKRMNTPEALSSLLNIYNGETTFLPVLSTLPSRAP